MSLDQFFVQVNLEINKNVPGGGEGIVYYLVVRCFFRKGKALRAYSSCQFTGIFPRRSRPVDVNAGFYCSFLLKNLKIQSIFPMQNLFDLWANLGSLRQNSRRTSTKERPVMPFLHSFISHTINQSINQSFQHSIHFVSEKLWAFPGPLAASLAQNWSAGTWRLPCQAKTFSNPRQWNLLGGKRAGSLLAWPRLVLLYRSTVLESAQLSRIILNPTGRPSPTKCSRVTTALSSSPLAAMLTLTRAAAVERIKSRRRSREIAPHFSVRLRTAIDQRSV